MRKIVSPVAFALLLSANFLTIVSHGLFGLGSGFTAVLLISLVALLLLAGARRLCA
jgi:hypothetical protein